MPLSRIFNIENMSFNAIREKKILEQISESTVHSGSSFCFAFPCAITITSQHAHINFVFKFLQIFKTLSSANDTYKIFEVLS